MPKIISFVVYLLVENDFEAPLRGTLRAITDDSTHPFADGLSLLNSLRWFRQHAAVADKNRNSKSKGRT